jgi:hypothetical protein
MKTANPMPPGGVEVIRHKAWNTKKYYTRSGHLARIYRRVPQRVKFKSKMVNDANQHLCGGWTYFDNDSNEIERRLVSGRKPLGSMADWSKDAADARARRLRDAGLVAAVGRNKFIDGLWNVEACHDIKLGEIGNIEELLLDYGTSLPVVIRYPRTTSTEFGQIRGALENCETSSLKSFLNGAWELWPACVTGLLLGYPVENTISLYGE